MSDIRTVPIVSVVGKGDSGKTTFLEKLIAELAGRGVKVATVKHHVHDYDIDVEGKDSWRHARAGAMTTMVSSPDKFALIREVHDELPLTAIARIAADSGADLLITEGYKIEGVNRIEVSRLARSDSLVCDPEELMAVVTDNPAIAAACTDDVPAFTLEDATGVAELICARFLQGCGDGAVSEPHREEAGD